jgi:hypothetical protein
MLKQDGAASVIKASKLEDAGKLARGAKVVDLPIRQIQKISDRLDALQHIAPQSRGRLLIHGDFVGERGTGASSSRLRHLPSPYGELSCLILFEWETIATHFNWPYNNPVEGRAAVVSVDKEQTFGYARAEKALRIVFNIDDDNIGSVRARIKMFQRLGLAPVKGLGRGKVIRYTNSNIYDWALALAMADFGLTPQRIALIITPGNFAKYIDMIATNPNSNDDIFLTIQPPSFQDYREGVFTEVITASSFNAGSLSSWEGFAWMVFNLSEIKRRVDTALGVAQGLD